ncbi:hypothetical protein Tco_1581474, partial [Tanacetum coccineum]
YDSWKRRMELYMMNRPHGRKILAFVEKGLLVWPSITVDGVTRLKGYTELISAEAIQAVCNIKAINIILQGLPTEIYALAVPTNTARKVNTVKPIVNNARPKAGFHKSISAFRKPLNRTTTLRTNFSKQKVNTAEVNAVSVVRGKRETAVKPSAGCYGIS